MVVVLNLLFLLSLMFWIGGMFFFSFAAAPSIFKVLPRELAGDVVADIFPKYYLVSYVCGFLILTVLLLKKYLFESTGGFINLNLVLVIVMLGLSIYAGEIIRPQAAEIKKEIRTIESGSVEYKKLDSRFKFIHLKSVICNIIVFIFGIAIIFINAYNYRVY
jgi:uncharacterized membrane protein